MASDELLELTEADFDLLDELPICGCGRSALAVETYHKLLTAAADFADESPTAPAEPAPDPFEPTDGNETLFYVAAGVLDRIEATEHGTSIHFAWITDKGRRLLALLEQWAESSYEATPCARLGAGSDDEDALG